jgi:tRNA uridine 5-carboxymethylaminomethyl modification enzyme
MHTGLEQRAGGRAGEGTTRGLSAELARLGVRMGRLKTGTPPRLARDSIDWEALELQRGDERPTPFSFLSSWEGFPRLPQVTCAITHTNALAHAIIRSNIHRAPMYAGRIQGVGPRYCPSVEDKVMRFADRESHQVFLEPEGLATDVVYVNGVSTSLPADVQEAFVRLIPGLERARFLRHGYAVEYDFSFPEQLEPTYALRAVDGLYLAGQINGTSGYEEAAAQGLMAGANAALWVQGRAPFVLGRHEAYAGVLADDLVTSALSEPYRMFTSRAEYRLLLRADDADRRLTPRALELGLAGRDRAVRLAERRRRLAEALALLGALREDGASLLELLRQPAHRLADFEARHAELAALGLDPGTRTTLEADVKYAGYVERAQADVERLRAEQETEIPIELNLAGVAGLRSEAREKLERFRPRTLGQAGRISGVQPPDVALLSVHVARWRRARAAAGD